LIILDWIVAARYLTHPYLQATVATAGA